MMMKYLKYMINYLLFDSAKTREAQEDKRRLLTSKRGYFEPVISCLALLNMIRLYKELE